MPEIQAFRGLRYDLGHVGSLGDVVAPPYDVISPQMRDELYNKHPANVVRLILNRAEPGDDAAANTYSRAAKFLKNWKEEGLLQRDAQPAVYVYHQVFDHAGRTFTRRGFMARVRLQRFGEGMIYPHEQTLAGPKADRLKLTYATRTNLSQIFGLYPDPEANVQDVLEAAIAGAPPVEATDHLGVVHRLWAVTDVDAVSKVAGMMSPLPIYVADGHHRYETACNYRDELAAAAGEAPPDHPANFVLMMCVGMNDPGMIVLPTHRLFRGAPRISSDGLISGLGEAFTCRVAGEGADLADSIWDEIEAEADQGTVGLYTAEDERWVLARITPAGRQQLRSAAPDQSEPWRSLGVAILHRLILETRLGLKDLPRPEYVHLVEDVVGGLEHGDPEGSGDFNLAALVMPATLDHIRAISEHGERMPAKSTYFYPKLLSGLVLNPLE